MHLRPLLLLALGTLVSAHVSAQHYRCSAGGKTYFSDRPCPDQSLRMYGAVRPTPQYQSHTPGVPKAQDHVKYLSSACASISEAIRTGPARGVKGDVIRGLHDEYRQKCSLEDQDARARVQQDRSGEMQTQITQRNNSRAEQEQARERADRCNGMRDVVALKRKREAELNAKEVEALRSLEKTYNEVCLAK